MPLDTRTRLCTTDTHVRGRATTRLCVRVCVCVCVSHHRLLELSTTISAGDGHRINMLRNLANSE